MVMMYFCAHMERVLKVRFKGQEGQWLHLGTLSSIPTYLHPHRGTLCSVLFHSTLLGQTKLLTF